MLGPVKLEEAVVHLVRLGLRGDAASVAKYAKRLLRDLAKQCDASPRVREELAALVASAPTAVTRFVEPAADFDVQFVTVEPPGDAEEPLLDRATTGQIEEVVREHDRAADLEAVGLHPTRTMLLTGPPGVGKTITARRIASRLGVPLFRLDLSALMSSYLGKSGQNLRAALAQARSVPSVMLLDEFDSIGKRRDDPADVGELKRIVNVLLIELEAWPVGGLLIAATNHPELLDRAVWRRFEHVVHINLPSADARKQIIARHLHRHGRSVQERTLAASVAGTVGASGSDLATLVQSVVRRAVLSNDADLDRALISATIDRLAAKAQSDPESRRLFCEVCSTSFDMTQRDIAAYLGISHVAVGKILRGARPTEGRSQIPNG